MSQIAYQIRDAAAAAKWSTASIQLLALRTREIDAAQEIINCAAHLPEHVRMLMLRDESLRTRAQVVQAFKDAAETEAVTRICGGTSAPEAFRTMRAYVTQAADGSERLMTIEEARDALARALAAQDVHIDTTRPVEPGDPIAFALNQIAERQYNKAGKK